MVFSYSAKRVKNPACEKNQYKLSELKILTESDEKNLYFVHKSNTDKYQKSSFPPQTPPKCDKVSSGLFVKFC